MLIAQLSNKVRIIEIKISKKITWQENGFTSS